jgi:hypothetical protein
MKSTLWTFGDSNTAGWGCQPSDEYYKKYYKSGNKIWPEWLSELFDTNLKNFGKSGSSNDTIIDTIIRKWDEINKGDYVFIGMTHPHRFDVPINNQFESIVHNFAEDKKESNLTETEFETIVNFQYYFADHILYKNRHIHRFEWIRKLLLKKGCNMAILWNVQTDLNGLQTIYDETNGEIIDNHLSFSSHKLLADIFYKKYITKDII